MVAKTPNLNAALKDYREVVTDTARSFLEATIDARQHLLGMEEVGEIESLVPGPYKLRRRRAVELHVLKRLYARLEWSIAGQADAFMGVILAATDKLQKKLEARLKVTGENHEIALASLEFLEITDFAASLCLALDLAKRPGMESLELLFECYEREVDENDLAGQYCKLLREKNELLFRLLRMRMEMEKRRTALWQMQWSMKQYKNFRPTNPVWRAYRTDDAGRIRRKELIQRRLNEIDAQCERALAETRNLMQQAHQIYDDSCALIVLALVEPGQNVSATLQRGRTIAQDFDELAEAIMNAEFNDLPDVLDEMFSPPKSGFYAAPLMVSPRASTGSSTRETSLVGRA